MPEIFVARAVLIVEDEFFVRLAAIAVIEEAGFKVFDADDADEAIAILEKHDDIGFVFTDINMPGSMDGVGLTHRVRDRWPPVQFIVTSGLHRIKDGDLPLGSIFVGKPYATGAVVNALQRLIVSNLPQGI